MMPSWIFTMLVVVLAATACGTDSAREGPPATGRAEPTAATSPTDREIFFPQVSPTDGSISMPEARGGGRLVLDDEGCLRMRIGSGDHETDWVPVWPSYFELDNGGEQVRVLDARNGRVVAEVGKKVIMGGGDIGKEALKENDILNERTWRELFERCPPDYGYWLVGEGVHMPAAEKTTE